MSWLTCKICGVSWATPFLYCHTCHEAMFKKLEEITFPRTESMDRQNTTNKKMLEQINMLCLEAYWKYDSDKRVWWPDDYEAFKEALYSTLWNEIINNLDSLSSMRNQYCWKRWHVFMTAWEWCSSILQEYWLLEWEYWTAANPYD